MGDTNNSVSKNINSNKKKDVLENRKCRARAIYTVETFERGVR